MKRPYEAFKGKGGDRPDPRELDAEEELLNAYHRWTQTQGMCGKWIIGTEYRLKEMVLYIIIYLYTFFGLGLAGESSGLA